MGGSFTQTGPASTFGYAPIAAPEIVVKLGPSREPVPKPASASTVTLRPYQRSAVDEIRKRLLNGAASVLLALSTGAGKTVIFSYIVASAIAKGKRVLILVHRRELLEQIGAALDAFDAQHGIIARGHKASAAPVQLAMIGTLVRRLDRVGQFDLIVVDECHHATAGQYRKVFEAFPGARVLGVTATPRRTDGTGLGDVFEAMVLGPSMSWLIEQGWLARYALYAPHQAQINTAGIKVARGDFEPAALADAANSARLTGDVIKHYERLAPGSKAVAFCVSVAHAESVAKAYNDAGITAACLHGKLSAEERAAIVADFKAGHITILTSCALISEGFDVPGIETAILLRPTMSVIEYLQEVGRALRPAPGKARATIIDHAGNVHRHGFPDDERQWSLDGKKRSAKSQEQSGPPISTCTNCFAAFRSSEPACPHCHTPKSAQTRTVEYVDGELVEVTTQRLLELDIEAWRQSVRDNGRTPILWPAQGTDEPMRADVWRTRENGEQGFKIRNESGDSVFISQRRITSPHQLDAIREAMGYKKTWASGLYFEAHHQRMPEGLEWRDANQAFAQALAS
ncbi:MAG: DEAD/DEAH box helicase [Pseudomonadota bacterium]